MQTTSSVASSIVIAITLAGCAGGDAAVATGESPESLAALAPAEPATPADAAAEGSGAPTDAAAEGASLGADGTYEVVVSHRSYLGWGPFTQQCTKPLPLTIYTPKGAPKSPVFLYLPGTGALPDVEGEGDAAARAFAARGVLSAVVSYASLSGFACGDMQEKAACTFSDGKPASAVATVCALPGADCGRGVVVGGLSQGAAMAVLSRNYTSRARAAWLMGFGGGRAGDPFTGCYVAARTAFADHQLRVIDGASDNQNIANLNAAIGTTCAATRQDCLRPDGSGFYRPSDAQVEDGNADHCFFVAPNASGGEVGCSNFPPAMDKNWAPPARAPWSLLTNLDWLASKLD